MSRAKIFQLAMIGLIASGAMIATTASAEPTSNCTPSGSGKVEFCVQKKGGELLVLGLPALENIEVLGVKTTLTAQVFHGTVIVFSCTAVGLVGVVDGSPTANPSIGSIRVVFTGCTVSSPAHCAVEDKSTKKTGEIETSELNGTVSDTEAGDIVLGPVSGVVALFNIISSGGTCAVASTGARLTGTVLAGLSEPETDLETHKLVFEKTTSLNLVLGEEESSIEFTLSEDIITDRPTTWSTTLWNEHPAYGLYFTSAIS